MSLLSFLIKHTTGVDITNIKVTKDDLNEMAKEIKTARKEVGQTVEKVKKAPKTMKEEWDNMSPEEKKQVKKEFALAPIYHLLCYDEFAGNGCWGVALWLICLPFIIIYRALGIFFSFIFS